MAGKKARTTVPTFPENSREKETLLEDLQAMGCAKLAELPWNLSSQDMVDEISGSRRPPPDFKGVRANFDTLSIGMVARAYDLENDGLKLAKGTEFAHNPEIAALFRTPGEKASKEGFDILDIRDNRVRNVFVFLMAILYPDHKTRIFKNMAVSIGGAYLQVRKMNWAQVLLDTIKKQAGGIGKYNYVCPYLFHVYYSEGQLTDEELREYDEHALKVMFNEEDTPRANSPEPEVPEKAAVDLKRKAPADPGVKGSVAKRTRGSLAAKSTARPAPRKVETEPDMNHAFGSVEREMSKIRGIFDHQEQVLGEIRELFPGNPRISELPELIRETRTKESEVRAQLSKEEKKGRDLMELAQEAQKDAKINRQIANEQALRVRELRGFFHMDPEVYVKAQLMNVDATSSGSVQPKQMIQMMAEFTKRVREAQKTLGLLQESIVEKLERLPPSPMPPRNPATVAAPPESPVRRLNLHKRPATEGPSRLSEQQSSFVDLEDSEDEPPLVVRKFVHGRLVEFTGAKLNSASDSIDSMSSSGESGSSSSAEEEKEEREKEAMGPELDRDQEGPHSGTIEKPTFVEDDPRFGDNQIFSLNREDPGTSQEEIPLSPQVIPEVKHPEPKRRLEESPEQRGAAREPIPAIFDIRSPTTSEIQRVIEGDFPLLTPEKTSAGPERPSGDTMTPGGIPSTIAPAGVTSDAKKAAKKARKKAKALKRKQEKGQDP